MFFYIYLTQLLAGVGLTINRLTRISCNPVKSDVCYLRMCMYVFLCFP